MLKENCYTLYCVCSTTINYFFDNEKNFVKFINHLCFVHCHTPTVYSHNKFALSTDVLLLKSEEAVGTMLLVTFPKLGESGTFCKT